MLILNIGATTNLHMQVREFAVTYALSFFQGWPRIPLFKELDYYFFFKNDTSSITYFIIQFLQTNVLPIKNNSSNEVTLITFNITYINL